MNITTDPPTPPYLAATWIRFRCDVLTSLPASYNWTGYCTSQGSKRVAFRHANLNNTNDIILSIRSTQTSCIDTVVCSAVDSMGNSGEASQWIANVTGKNYSAEFVAYICTIAHPSRSTATKLAVAMPLHLHVFYLKWMFEIRLW